MTEALATPAIVELRETTILLDTGNGQRLEGVNLTVREGEWWVIAGPNRSGKSALLATTAALQPPHKGEVLIQGINPDSCEPDEAVRLRLQLGFVFGSGGRLFSRMTLRENIALPLAYHSDLLGAGTTDPAIADAWIAELGLRSQADLTPERAPASARQRTALARALVLRPNVLVLDQPTALLDPVETRWWRDTLERLNSSPHPAIGHRLSLVLGTDSFRQWTRVGHRFGAVAGGRWHDLGAADALGRLEDPVLRGLADID